MRTAVYEYFLLKAEQQQKNPISEENFTSAVAFFFSDSLTALGDFLFPDYFAFPDRPPRLEDGNKI